MRSRVAAGRPIAGMALALVMAATGCGEASQAGQGSASPRGSASPPAVPITEPEPGQRWESYAGIQFQVPQQWGWNSFRTPLDRSWCAGGVRADKPPETVGSVNRWYQVPFPAILCDGVRPVEGMAPSVDLGFGLVAVSTDDAGNGLVEYGDGWVTATTTVAGVTVAVTDNDAARRERIVASIQPVTGADAHGCPLDSALRTAGSRPAGGPVPNSADAPTSSICRYALPDTEPGEAGGSPLLASSRLVHGGTRALVDAIRAAPPGSGPDNPDDCAGIGGQMVVVRLNAADGAHEVAIRYDGGVGNGVDDGVTTRTLTSSITHLVLTGPHAWSGSCVGGLLRP